MVIGGIIGSIVWAVATLLYPTTLCGSLVAAVVFHVTGKQKRARLLLFRSLIFHGILFVVGYGAVLLDPTWVDNGVVQNIPPSDFFRWTFFSTAGFLEIPVLLLWGIFLLIVRFRKGIRR